MSAGGLDPTAARLNAENEEQVLRALDEALVDMLRAVEGCVLLQQV
jgi:hypothetical protein